MDGLTVTIALFLVYPSIIGFSVIGSVLYAKGLAKEKREENGKGLKIGGLITLIGVGLFLLVYSICLCLKSSIYVEVIAIAVVTAMFNSGLHLLIRGYALHDKQVIRCGWTLFIISGVVFIVLLFLLALLIVFALSIGGM